MRLPSPLPETFPRLWAYVGYLHMSSQPLSLGVTRSIVRGAATVVTYRAGRLEQLLEQLLDLPLLA